MGPVLLDNCMHIATKGVKWTCQEVSSDCVTTNSILGPSVIKGVDGQRVGSMHYRVDCSKYNVHNGTHSEFCTFFAHGAWDWCLPEIMQEPTLHLCLSPPFLFVRGEVLTRKFSNASSDSIFYPPLSRIFFFQSPSSPAFFTSLLTQSSHLSRGLTRLRLPCSRNSAALFSSLSSAILLIRVHPL